MDKSVGVAVVGCGGISGYHIPALSSVERARVVAVCDTNARRAESTARKYKINKWFTDYDDLLAAEDVDAVVLLTPNHTHCKFAVRAAEAGKHAMVQKPFARTVEECHRMIDAAHKAGTKLVPSFMHRYLPETVKAKEYLSRGLIGRPYMVRIRNGVEGPNHAAWFFDKEKTGGGAVIDVGVHGIDILRYLIGEITEVAARMDICKKVRILDDGSTCFPQTEDNAVIIYSVGDGVMGVQEISWTQLNGCKRFEAEIYGEEGVICIRTPMAPLAIASTKLGSVNEWFIPKLPQHPFGYLQHKAFIDAIIDNTEPDVTGEDGLATIRVVKAIYESAAERRFVQLL